MRRTSIQAYQYILSSGILGQRRTTAYRLLYANGPATAQELQKVSNVPGIWKRLSELREMGVAYEVQQRTCHATGRQAIEWDLTNAMPTEPYSKPDSPMAKLKVENKRLRKRITELEEQLPNQLRLA